MPLCSLTLDVPEASRESALYQLFAAAAGAPAHPHSCVHVPGTTKQRPSSSARATPRRRGVPHSERDVGGRGMTVGQLCKLFIEATCIDTTEAAVFAGRQGRPISPEDVHQVFREVQRGMPVCSDSLGFCGFRLAIRKLSERIFPTLKASCADAQLAVLILRARPRASLVGFDGRGCRDVVERLTAKSAATGCCKYGRQYSSALRAATPRASMPLRTTRLADVHGVGTSGCMAVLAQ